jgi:hypothetical protein
MMWLPVGMSGRVSYDRRLFNVSVKNTVDLE